MNIDWKAFTGGLSGGLRELRGGAPEVMKGFSEIAQAALKTDALGTKTKELIALAVATCMS